MDLTVKQIQSDLPFENEFRLPVDVEIADASGAVTTHRVELSGWSTTVALPAASRPRRVTFDKGGWLVCEVKYDRPIGEVLDELDHGDLAAACVRRASSPTTSAATRERWRRSRALLADPATHWGLKQEAALDLGRAGGARRGAGPREGPDVGASRTRACAAPSALGLGACGEASSAAALRRAIETRPRGGRHRRLRDLPRAASAVPGTKDYLVRQLSRSSRWCDSIRVSALMGLGKLRGPVARRRCSTAYTDAKYVQDVRAAAVAAWASAAPDDPKLAERLRQLTSDRNRSIREDAVKRLGALHHESDLPLLRELEGDPDPTIAQFAREGVEGTEAFVKK